MACRIMNKKRVMGLLILVLLMESVITVLMAMLYSNKHAVAWNGQVHEDESMTVIPDRWIVTSSLQDNDVSEIPGWIILLYGSGKHESCRYPVCATLDNWHPHPVLDNSTQHFQATYNRRISAYLYAISQGAVFICSVERLHTGIEDLVSRFFYKGTTTGVVPITNATYVQPSTLFIRGNPGQMLRDHLLLTPHNMSYRYAIKKNILPSIQISTEMLGHTYYTDILEQLPPVFLPMNTFTSLRSDTILFRYDAFWALGMFELGNELRYFVMQKLIWLHGASVGLFPVSVHENPPIRNYSSRDEEIKHQMLNKWKCNEQVPFNCISNFVKLCHEHKILLEEELNIVRLFLKELKNLGYSFPKPTENDNVMNLASTTFGILKLPTNSFPESSIASKALTNYCPEAHIDFSMKFIDDIGLIIAFNKLEYYRNIPLLEAMYRPYFKHILYCGPNITAFLAPAHNSSIGYFIFIEAFKQKWYFMYDCTAEAMKLNLNVDGFIQIGDDTILNPWNIYDLPRHKVWLHTGMKMLPVSLQTYDWLFWKSGKTKVIRLLNEMQGNSLVNQNTPLQRFITNFRSNTINYNHVFISGCDFMYMPTKLKDDFILVSDMFTKHGIMLEVGYANMVMCLQKKENIHIIQDGHLWRSNRKTWTSVYNRNLIFMHPFKLGKFLKQTEGLRILCGDYFNSSHNLLS